MSIVGKKKKASDDLAKLPDTPGVYFFKRGKNILYIGKATSLKERVRSYFSADLFNARGPRIVQMVEEADRIDFETTDSVLEALILEANLIRKYQPPYNVKEKDNKSYAYVVITDEEFPRVFVVRGRELETDIDPDSLKYTFGPYPSSVSLRGALSIIRKIFPFRGEKDPVVPRKRESTLNRQLGIVPDFRTTDAREYGRTINHIRLFFQGKKKELIKTLEREMKQAVKEEAFEKAGALKHDIFALQHINDIALIKDVVKESKAGQGEQSIRIEAYDIAHTSGKEMTGVMTVVEDGFAKKSDYRKFKVKTVQGSNDTAALKEVLERRLNHDEWPYPKLIVLDGGKAQLNAAREVLDQAGFKIPTVAVVKDEYHRPREIIGDKRFARTHESEIAIANSEAHRFALDYHRDLRDRLQLKRLRRGK